MSSLLRRYVMMSPTMSVLLTGPTLSIIWRLTSGVISRTRPSTFGFRLQEESSRSSRLGLAALPLPGDLDFPISDIGEWDLEGEILLPGKRPSSVSCFTTLDLELSWLLRTGLVRSVSDNQFQCRSANIISRITTSFLKLLASKGIHKFYVNSEMWSGSIITVLPKLELKFYKEETKTSIWLK